MALVVDKPKGPDGPSAFYFQTFCFQTNLCDHCQDTHRIKGSLVEKLRVAESERCLALEAIMIHYAQLACGSRGHEVQLACASRNYS